MTASGLAIVYDVELRCLQCARDVGALEAPAWPWRGATLLHIRNQPVAAIADWTTLRCAACSGNLYADQVTSRRIYPPVNWDDERPRRGRPPRWLVEQRQQNGRLELQEP